ncbi:MAG TPA: hypothetical protein VJC37_06865 [Planctomycetota bacterium]|nr:hypothetical protein [Planctomycetota bacterium]
MNNSDSRTGLFFAIPLAAFGMLRFISDMLTDASADWYQMLEGTFWRYLVRAPSDGTFWGGLSVQWVKLLAVPCGISVLFLLYRFLSHNLKEADYRWRQTSTRLIYVLGFLFMVTIMEIEKSTHLFGLRMAGQLAGEAAWLNHVLHLASALMGWFYMKWLRLTPSDSV